MVVKYVIAGTSPPAWFTKSIHILLKEAVQTAWPTVTVDPPVANIRFTNTWFSDYADIEIVFLHSVDDMSLNRRSVDWHRVPTTTFNDIHLFVRGDSVDEEPALLHKTKAALESVIELNKQTLIPHTVITLESSDYVPERDNQQNVWHWLYSCSIRYHKVITNVV